MLALVVQFLSRTPVVTDRLHTTAQLVLSRTPGLLLCRSKSALLSNWWGRLQQLYRRFHARFHR